MVRALARGSGFDSPHPHILPREITLAFSFSRDNNLATSKYIKYTAKQISQLFADSIHRICICICRSHLCAAHPGSIIESNMKA